MILTLICVDYSPTPDKKTCIDELASVCFRLHCFLPLLPKMYQVSYVNMSCLRVHTIIPFTHCLTHQVAFLCRASQYLSTSFKVYQRSRRIHLRQLLKNGGRESNSPAENLLT